MQPGDECIQDRAVSGYDTGHRVPGPVEVRMPVRVTIDPDLCIGSGDCTRVAPDAFRLDDAAGVSVPTEIAPLTPIDRLRRAALGCPTQAIAVEGEEAGR